MYQPLESSRQLLDLLLECVGAPGMLLGAAFPPLSSFLASFQPRWWLRMGEGDPRVAFIPRVGYCFIPSSHQQSSHRGFIAKPMAICCHRVPAGDEEGAGGAAGEGGEVGKGVSLPAAG